MSIRDLPQTQTVSIHAFMLMLVGILCLSIAPVASGFMSLQQQRGTRPDTMVDKVHAQHWNISYSYGGDCQPDDKNNDEALTKAITEVLQMWLEPLREYSKKPIVSDFRYLLDADRDASDLTVVFHCRNRVSTATLLVGKSPQIDMREGTKVTRNFMEAFMHEMGHAFGLADTYIPADKWGDPELDKGGQDSTKGTQPASLMSGNTIHRDGNPVLGQDDKNGVIWLYKVIYEGLSIVDCFFPDYKLENPPLGCIPKRPLIFELKHGIEVRVLRMLKQDETLDLNARDADGMTALHHAFINEYTRVVDALLSFEDIDVNARDAKGLTALHHAVLLNATEIVEKLLAHAKIKVNIRNNDGRTPAQLARDIGRFQFTKLIWEHPTAKLPPWSVTSAGKLTTTWGHLKKQD